MPYRNKQMLRDANGDLIPQYWDVAEQEFKPLTGSDGANDVRLTGSNVEVLLSGEVQNDWRFSTIYIGETYKTASGASELRGVDVRGYKEIAFNVINNSDKNIFLRHVYFGDNEYPGRRNEGMIFRLYNVGLEFGVNNEDTSLISRSTISPGEIETNQGDLYKLLKVSYLYFGFSLQTSDNEPINDGSIKFNVFGIK